MDANALRGRRLLIVDDNQPSRDLMKMIIVAAGATADEATNGEEAVEACGTTPYDAVLMDIQMPLLDGMEATRILRTREADTGVQPMLIIAVTAHAMVEHRQQCLDAGMDAVITKPIDPLSVIDEVAALLSSTR